mmetsp:Transcript_16033/g.40215  ORF Transcript_16033/g.40215 Transcript_16033/m.40215 type:complete len:390 (+) Transcript_16033:22-1191(+)
MASYVICDTTRNFLSVLLKFRTLNIINTTLPASVLFGIDPSYTIHKSSYTTIERRETKMGNYYSSSSTVAPTPEVGEHILATVDGFIKKDFEPGEETDGWRRWYFGWPWKKPKEAPWSHAWVSLTPTQVKMHNARLIQEAWKGDKASFFDKHGFVLIKAPTKVKDWNEDYLNEETDISKIYHQEIETLIREVLFPEDTEFTKIDQQHAVLRRGPSSKANFYGNGVHQDYCLTIDQVKRSSEAYVGGEELQEMNDTFDAALQDSDTFCTVCFWRPINMEKPLLNNPLCVLDRSTLKEKDMVKTELYGFGTIPNKPLVQLNLKHDDDQRWCYYPDMTCDEVLVLKQFNYQKSDPDAAYKCSFHSAFVDHRETSSNREYRQSTEHRVGIFLK